MPTLGGNSSCPKRVESTSPMSDRTPPKPASTEASNASHSAGSLIPHSGISPSNYVDVKIDLIFGITSEGQMW